MKRSLLLLLAAFATLAASAQTKVEIDGIWYNLVPKTKQAEVTFKGEKYWDYENEYSNSITIPAKVTYAGTDYNVISIGDNAFYECSSLTDITIPESVTSIGEEAFSNCENLTAITFPEGLTNIGGWAFVYCESITCINIPASVTSIGESAFVGCIGLTSITVADGNLTYDSRGGCNAIIETSSNTLVSGCTTTIIPESVTSIEFCAFRDNSNLTSIIIPESVTSIGYEVFRYCTNLTTINIPEGVTSFEYGLFAWCENLTAITIPKSITNIDRYVFAGCSSLSDVYCYAETVPTTGENAFEESNIQNATLHVPASALETYKTTSPWRNFGTIVRLTDEETGIKNSELNIQNPELIYDLHGRRVEKAEKGIYIVNGKKTVIK